MALVFCLSGSRITAAVNVLKKVVFVRFMYAKYQQFLISHTHTKQQKALRIIYKKQEKKKTEVQVSIHYLKV